jgi:hypothetical protein
MTDAHSRWPVVRRVHRIDRGALTPSADLRAEVRIGSWHDGATDHDHDESRRWVARTTRHGVAASGRQPPLRFRHRAGRCWAAMAGVVAATGEESPLTIVARISGPPLSYCDTRLVGVMDHGFVMDRPDLSRETASRMAPPAGRDDRTFIRYSSTTASASRLPRPHRNVADGTRNGRCRDPVSNVQPKPRPRFAKPRDRVQRPGLAVERLRVGASGPTGSGKVPFRDCGGAVSGSNAS